MGCEQASRDCAGERVVGSGSAQSFWARVYWWMQVPVLWSEPSRLLWLFWQFRS
jgi:hypothetical protein